ncbi:MAG: ADP-ribosylglycohydrolase family protein [Prolixibacteraceae bacterium]|nr:ADP-ribosylglycohydrolase family protein [Prolixibacteraceae bacterium]
MQNNLFLFLILIVFVATTSCNKKQSSTPVKTTLTTEILKDKIKGGWAGQVIGCTFGGPTEFQYKGTLIQDYQPIPWNNGRCKWYYENSPGLYDDVYMDLTFVDVFEKEGLDAPASSHANAFANAEYMLWHANQAARYNILNGITPPQSGHWLNNPHADDIDFQIEADFAGLMSPGMVNTSTDICDKVGHIMNYGDGWYGGVYVAAMYSLAFVSNDVNYIVTEALKSIPQESEFYKCMSDVIGWKKEFPTDWKRNWFECERKWSSDIGCPDGVFNSFNIDAKINAAYIIIGLLYGEGDFGKTMEISTRCGQDSDCNPASAGGILGTMLGYSTIPEYWRAPVYPVENMDFKYTTMSLNDVYELGYKHAIAVLEKNGATINGDAVEIPFQEIVPAKLEVCFEGHFPIERNHVGKQLNSINKESEFEFEGNGFVLTGNAQKLNRDLPEGVLEFEVYVDEQKVEQIKMPTIYTTRRHEVAWKYNLPEGKHQVKLKLLNPQEGYEVRADHLLVYSSVKPANAWKTN